MRNAQTPAPRSEPAPQSPELRHREFRLIVQMLNADAGIAMDESKLPLVQSRLAHRLRDLRLRSFASYCVLLSSEKGATERVRMREALTTNVTRFFREAHHFEHLKTAVLPHLIAQAKKGGRIRLWSAGCSTGEEPYSIALTLLAAMPDAPRYDIRILASDIDSNVLGIAREGIYSTRSLASVNDEMRERWFEQVDDAAPPAWRIGSEARALVAIRIHNLVGDWPMRGPFQAIFCRNTVIYFDEPTRSAVWTRMQSLLTPGGYLYTGHSERLPPDATQMKQAGLTIYRRSGAREGAADSDGGLNA